MEGIEYQIYQFLQQWNDPQSYIVVHTSGSTGRPKDIHLPKEMMVRSAQRTINFFGLTAESRLHLCLSTDYIAGKMMVIRALQSGAQLTCEIPSNDILKPCESENPHPIDLLAVVPSQLQCLLSNPERLQKVRNLLVGGAAIPLSLRNELVASGVTAWESYGMTETASHVALRRLTPNFNEPFRLLNGISYSVGDAGNIILTVDAQRFVTNDAVLPISDTTFQLRGRLDNVINTGGIKVFPTDVEQRIETEMARMAPGCKFYISSLPDQKWGERVVLMIENPVSQQVCESILERLHVVLNAYERPKEIVCAGRFSYTSTGKLIRKKNCNFAE